MKKNTLKRTLYWALCLWLITIGLFLLNQFYPNGMIISMAVLLLIYCALPALIISLVEFVRCYCQYNNAKIINYFIFVISIYAIGELIDFLLINKISYFSLKLLFIIHIIFVFWILFFYANLIIVRLIGSRFKQLSERKLRIIFLNLFFINILVLKFIADYLVLDKYMNQFLAWLFALGY